MKHSNTQQPCSKCKEILAKYPGFNVRMEAWFFDLQRKHPEAHVSCGGRGKKDQEDALKRGASRAHWLQSAHNFNAALDIFFLVDAAASYSTKLYNTILKPNLPDWLVWGATWKTFRELPHVELKNWKALKLKAVE